MSRESLKQAVKLAGSQAKLAQAIRERMPNSSLCQVHIHGWLNLVKMEVPPAETVLPIAQALDYQLTPHQLRPDIYPNPTDAMPIEIVIKRPQI